MQSGVGKYEDHHDVSLKKIQRRYQLEPTRLYFLTLFLREDGTFSGKYSFDVEAADDSHYVFTTKQEAYIRAAIGAEDNETLAEAMVRYLKTHTGGQLEAAVEFRCIEQHHFY